MIAGNRGRGIELRVEFEEYTLKYVLQQRTNSPYRQSSWLYGLQCWISVERTRQSM